uniref:Si:ch211-231f6.6 n=1 Tax=Oryzias latipes TaxID=8090 RepID=A0A3P9J578_ORYLA
MSTSRIFSALTRLALHPGFPNNVLTRTCALRNARLLAVSAQVSSKSQGSEDVQPIDEPIKFSTSKASHKTWRVKRSMGSHFERPWWKVAPISLLGAVFLLWCAFRGETDIDKQLERHLYEQLPGLVSTEEPDEPQNK